MEKVLVSTCLLGVACRYDGKSVANEELLKEMSGRIQMIPFCPEVYGGLTTPRAPSEIVNGRVISNEGRDVTYEYNRGAEEALALCKRLGIRCAVLKSRSPSCGKGMIYDGTFSGRLTEGDGVCAKLLSENGIAVFSSDDLAGFIGFLEKQNI